MKCFTALLQLMPTQTIVQDLSHAFIKLSSNFQSNQESLLWCLNRGRFTICNYVCTCILVGVCRHPSVQAHAPWTVTFGVFLAVGSWVDWISLRQTGISVVSRHMNAIEIKNPELLLSTGVGDVSGKCGSVSQEILGTEWGGTFSALRGLLCAFQVFSLCRELLTPDSPGRVQALAISGTFQCSASTHRAPSAPALLGVTPRLAQLLTGISH